MKPPDRPHSRRLHGAALALAVLLGGCGSDDAAGAQGSDDQAAWTASLHAADDLLYGVMEGIEIKSVKTYPAPDTYSSFVGSIFEGMSLTAGEILGSLPADHPFWRRHPARLAALQQAEPGVEVGTLLEVSSNPAANWETARASFARSMQWFRLTQVVMTLEDSDASLSEPLVAAVVGKLEAQAPGRGVAWRAALDAFEAARAREAERQGVTAAELRKTRQARSEALLPLRSLTSAEADRASLEHYRETYGADSDLAFLYEMFQLRWRLKSGLFDPDAARWQ